MCAPAPKLLEPGGQEAHLSARQSSLQAAQVCQFCLGAQSVFMNMEI